MVSAYYSTQLSADGTDLTTASLRFMFRIVSGFAENWETRGVDVILPALDGQIPYDRKLNRLLIVARGMVHGTGAGETAQRVDFAAAKAELRALMDPTQDPYTLTYTDEGGATYTIEARPLPGNPEWGDDDLPTRADVALSWVAIGADWVAGGS